MTKHHHDYSLDKDTPDNIRQLVDQGLKVDHRSQHGLPAGHSVSDPTKVEDADFNSEDEADDLTMAGIATHGKGADRSLHSEFHSKKLF